MSETDNSFLQTQSKATNFKLHHEPVYTDNLGMQGYQLNNRNTSPMTVPRLTRHTSTSNQQLTSSNPPTAIHQNNTSSPQNKQRVQSIPSSALHQAHQPNPSNAEPPHSPIHNIICSAIHTPKLSSTCAKNFLTRDPSFLEPLPPTPAPRITLHDMNDVLTCQSVNRAGKNWKPPRPCCNKITLLPRRCKIIRLLYPASAVCWKECYCKTWSGKLPNLPDMGI